MTATYDFDGVEPKHMSFKSGSQIEVLEKNDDWWHGRIQGTSTTGWFPSNRAAPPKGPIKTLKKAPPPPGATVAKKEASRQGSNIFFIDQLSLFLNVLKLSIEFSHHEDDKIFFIL